MVSNMYKNEENIFVTKNPIRFACWKYGNTCKYCYVKFFPPHIRKWFESEKPELNEKFFNENFKNGENVFICSCTDMFNDSIPTDMIKRVIDYASNFPSVNFYIQSKNVERMYNFIEKYNHAIGNNIIFGCTLETYSISTNNVSGGDTPLNRVTYMSMISKIRKTKYITIEPILDFHYANTFIDCIKMVNPSWVWVGSDSKYFKSKDGLENPMLEPSEDKILELIGGLLEAHIEVKIKDNLYRLVSKDKVDELFNNKSNK